MKIGIIGTGKIGTRLAEQLVIDGTCKEICLSNRSTDKLEGTVLSLRVWAHSINAHTTIGQLDWDSINSLDIIVLAIKERYDPRLRLKDNPPPPWVPQELRYAGILSDLPQLQKLCSKLVDYHGKVAILTNPVDVMSAFAARFLPNATVFGLGCSVDAVRLSYLLSQRLGIAIPATGVPLGGEHGHQIVPLVSLWQLPQDHSQLIIESLRELTPLANELSINIVSNLGYTLQDCAVAFARDLAWLAGKRPISEHAVFSVPYQLGSIGIPLLWEEKTTPRSCLELLSIKEKQSLDAARTRIVTLTKRLADFLEFS